MDYYEEKLKELRRLIILVTDGLDHVVKTAHLYYEFTSPVTIYCVVEQRNVAWQAQFALENNVNYVKRFILVQY